MILESIKNIFHGFATHGSCFIVPKSYDILRSESDGLLWHGRNENYI
jgi:hypothetical protein